jgi:hypothetical protein
MRKNAREKLKTNVENLHKSPEKPANIGSFSAKTRNYARITHSNEWLGRWLAGRNAFLLGPENA